MISAALRLHAERPLHPMALLRACWEGTVALGLDRGEYLYLPGDPARSVFLVRQGFLRVGRLLSSGGELTLDLAGPGEVLGEEAVLGTGHRVGLAQALESVRVSPLPAPTLESVLRRSATLSLTLARILGERSQRAEDRAVQSALADCRRRLARVLLEMAERFGADEDGGRRILPRLTHEELARFIGAARETVTPLLVELRREGLLHYDRRRLLVRNAPRLQQIAAGR